MGLDIGTTGTKAVVFDLKGRILAGGMDNTDTLINGPIERIEAEVREIIDLGRDGGIVIGTHSISPEIPLDHFIAYYHICQTYGDFSK